MSGHSVIFGIGPAGKMVPVQVDANGVVSVSGGGGGGGGSSIDRELVVSTFRAVAAATGYSIGNTITATRVLDVSGPTVSQVGATVWFNETTGLGLASAPSVANLELVGTPSLTDAQLRATPVPVLPRNLNTKFRDAFEVFTPGASWNLTTGTGDIVQLDGNAASASYLVISKDPLSQGTESVIESTQTFRMPFDLAFGLHTSQRTLGQEIYAEAVSDEAPIATPSDIAISSITQATTTLTITTAAPHGLLPGMRIGVRGCSDSRLNYPAVVIATTPTPTTMTVLNGPMGAITSLTAGPFTSGWIFYRSAMRGAQNGTSMALENATATNASFFVRSEAGDVLPSAAIVGNHSVSVATTASTQAVVSPLTYAFQPPSEFRLVQMIEGLQWMDYVTDGIGSYSSRLKRTQVVPDPSVAYKVRVRATNNKSLTVPVAQIVSVAKTGTTTATVITNVAHGLTTGDFVNAYGTRDQTNFANLAAATVVASVVNSTTFTIVWGTAVTATTYGGYVSSVNGGVLQQGAVAIVAQSVSRTSNIVTVVGSGTWAGFVIGDYVNLVGVRDNSAGASIGIDGAYRVRDFVTTSLVLEPIGATPTGANIGSVNCGGGVIKRTDVRLSYVRVLDFERQRVEATVRPLGDASSSTPVIVQNVPAVTVNSGTITTVSAVTAVTTVSAVTSANLGIPLTVADVASAALTATATTAAIVPASGMSYVVSIPVTAVTGTTPTLDFSIEESDDTGANWYKVYDFPRITATGMYRSPKLAMNGNRVRYVQTVAGTTPSFTRAVNRLQCNDMADPIRQLIDRSVVLTTLNATTPSLNIQNCSNVQLLVNVGAITTTAPVLQLEGSDDNGATWYSLGATLTAVASTTVRLSAPDTQAQLVRARVSTAGVGVTAGYVLLKGF